jgi:putative tryptophan/tyrosine transport system substrate-binding protein
MTRCRSSTIVNIGDPVEYGLVRSMARPGGNITGISNLSDDLLAKRVEILREALPRATRVAVLCNLSDPVQEDRLRTTQAAARRVNLDLATVHIAPRLASHRVVWPVSTWWIRLDRLGKT